MPAAVMMMSFVRPVIARKPSASISPRSPLRNQPSSYRGLRSPPRRRGSRGSSRACGRAPHRRRRCAPPLPGSGRPTLPMRTSSFRRRGGQGRCSRSGRTPRAPGCRATRGTRARRGRSAPPPTARLAYPRHAELLSKRPAEEEPRQECTTPGRRAEPPHASGRDLGSPPLPQRVVPRFSRLAFRHPELDAGHELLPHPGHAEEEGGLHLPEVVRERLAALAEVHDVAGPTALIDRDQPFGDVAQREVRQRPPRRRGAP